MKKYLTILGMTIGILIMPHFSFASIQADNQTGITTSTVGIAIGSISFDTGSVMNSDIGTNGLYVKFWLNGNNMSGMGMPELYHGTYSDGTNNSRPLFLYDGSGTLVKDCMNYYCTFPNTATGTYIAYYGASSSWNGNHYGLAQNFTNGNHISMGISDVITTWITNQTVTDGGNTFMSVTSTGMLYGCSATTLAEAETCTSTPTGSSFNFLYPTNGTTTAPFNAYAIEYNNLIATHTYQTTINWFIPQVSQTLTTSLSQTGAILEPASLISKNGQNFNIQTQATSSYVVAQASLFDTTESASGTLIATSSITFLQLPQGGNGTTTFINVELIGTSTILNQTYNPILSPVGVTSSSFFALTCEQPSGTLDIGGGLLYAGCALANVIFLPQSNFTQIISNSIQGLQNIFPFSLYFNTVGGIQNAITNNNTTTAQTLPLKVMGLNGQYITLATLDSSTLVDVFTTASTSQATAEEDVGNYMNVMKMIIWMTAGLKIVGMVISL